MKKGELLNWGEKSFALKQTFMESVDDLLVSQCNDIVKEKKLEKITEKVVAEAFFDICNMLYLRLPDEYKKTGLRIRNQNENSKTS